MGKERGVERVWRRGTTVGNSRRRAGAGWRGLCGESALLCGSEMGASINSRVEAEGMRESTHDGQHDKDNGTEDAAEDDPLGPAK